MTSLSRSGVAACCVVLLACDAGHSGASASSSAAPAAAAPESASAAAVAPSATVSAAVADPALSRKGLRWALSCKPAELTMATRDELSVVISVTNESKETVDAERHRMSFTSDGGGRLGLTFGNGHFDKKWTALPPGETVTDSRSMGKSLLTKPGDVHISVSNDGATASCAVHVDP